MISYKLKTVKLKVIQMYFLIYQVTRMSMITEQYKKLALGIIEQKSHLCMQVSKCFHGHAPTFMHHIVHRIYAMS